MSILRKLAGVLINPKQGTTTSNPKMEIKDILNKKVLTKAEIKNQIEKVLKRHDAENALPKIKGPGPGNNTPNPGLFKLGGEFLIILMPY
jgi:hypothetical protein